MTPAADRWTPPEMELIREEEGHPLKESDAPWLGNSPFVFKPRAVLALGPFLRQHGELLPLVCPDVRLMLFNPLHVLDALDENASQTSRLDTGLLVAVRKYVFHRDRIAHCAIFKLSCFRVSPTYVTDAFVERWHAAQLKGIRFREIWRG